MKTLTIIFVLLYLLVSSLAYGEGINSYECYIEKGSADHMNSNESHRYTYGEFYGKTLSKYLTIEKYFKTKVFIKLSHSDDFKNVKIKNRHGVALVTINNDVSKTMDGEKIKAKKSKKLL